MDGVTLRRAVPLDAPRVLGVLDEAAAHLAAQGIVQWPPAFRLEWLEPALSSGNVWLAERDDVALGTLTLNWADVLWPRAGSPGASGIDDDGTAGYLHRFAVRRVAAGLGGALLEWTAGAVRAAGRGSLRLDCMADNPALRAYYERAGFVHVDDIEVPRAAIRWSVRVPLVSRYERAL